MAPGQKILGTLIKQYTGWWRGFCMMCDLSKYRCVTHKNSSNLAMICELTVQPEVCFMKCCKLFTCFMIWTKKRLVICDWDPSFTTLTIKRWRPDWRRNIGLSVGTSTFFLLKFPVVVVFSCFHFECQKTLGMWLCGLSVWLLKLFKILRQTLIVWFTNNYNYYNCL